MQHCLTENYFSLLNLSPSMAVEASVLRDAYFDAQRRFHPDKASTPEQRLQFLQHSADINAAYRTLKEPDSRLFYLLKLHGVDVLAEGSVAPPTPSCILMECMDWQEQWLEAQTPEAKAQVRSALARAKDSARLAAIAALESGNVSEAASSALRLRYLGKVSD
jgi:molecular chaperone HscB